MKQKRTDVAKSGIFAILLALLMVWSGTALAMAVPQLIFQDAGLSRGQNFAVYSAPSESAWRGANGKASVSTNDWVNTAGYDGNWLLISYETSGGKVRAGYINSNQIWGNMPAWRLLNFNGVAVTVIKKCDVTDDPVKVSSKLTTLKKGAFVTFLAMYNDWAYIETNVGNQTARGFVKANCLDMNSVTAFYAAIPDGSDLLWDEEVNNGDDWLVDEELPSVMPQEEYLPADEPDDPADDPAEQPLLDVQVDLWTIPTPPPPADDQPGEETLQDRAVTDEDPDQEDRQTMTEYVPVTPPGDSSDGNDLSDEQVTTTVPVTTPTPSSWTEEGVDYERTSVPTVQVPPEAQPKKGPTGPGESQKTDVGANWYGVCYHVYDDNIDYYVYETDERGYLKNVPSGYVTTQFLYSAQYFYPCTTWLWELANGDLLVETSHLMTESNGVAEFTQEWQLLRPTGKDFVLLMSAEFNEYARRGFMADYRHGVKIVFNAEKAFTRSNGRSTQANKWLANVLARFFNEWELTFYEGPALYDNVFKKGSDYVAVSVRGNDAVRVLYSKESYNLPKLFELRDEAAAHFIEPEREEGDVFLAITQEMAAAGVSITQTGVSEWRGMAMTNFTANGATIAFGQDPATKKIIYIRVDDTKLYTFRLCKSAQDLGKLETTIAMRRIYHALLACPSLGFTDADGLSAFNLQWTDTETDAGHFAVIGTHEAGNADVELYRRYQRAGAESISSYLTINIH